MEFDRSDAITHRTFSTEKDDRNDIGRLLEANSSTNKRHHLRLYYVRIYDIKDKLKVQIDFGKHIKFTFSEGKRLYDKNSFSPIVYTLDLVLIINNHGQLYAEHQEQFKSIGEYRLNSSHIGVIGRHFEEKRELGHSLCDYLGNGNEHLFLFDIRFHSYYGFHLPGQDTGLFTDLCLFTCLLLRDQMYDLFHILAQQFRITSSRDNYTFTKRDFQDFFENCLKYLQNIPMDFHNDPMALKIILRMIGLLAPMKKESFDRDFSSANEFTNNMMFHIRANIQPLLKLMDGSEWLLFSSGLTILSTFEILYQPLDHSNGNKFGFLHQISNEKQRQNLANELLLQLFQLEQPIFGNSNWTDLFIIVDPQKIDINHLNLAPSFETFIQCITKISTVLKKHQHFEEKIVACLENRVLYNHLQIDLHSLLYLLTFLEQELTDDHPVTKHFLSTVQYAIRNSAALKKQMKEYFDKLEITIENMEDIRVVICSIDQFQLFHYMDKYEYLSKSLSNVYSYDYYIKWFQCFFMSSQIRDNTEQKKCKKLLESWLYCARSKYKTFTQVLMSIDELLAALDKVDDADWFRVYFIDRIIDLCFHEGISPRNHRESIFSLIADGLLLVQNQSFLIQFQQTFAEKYLSHTPKDLLKEMNSNDNPLCQLIDLDKRENSKSLLVRNLIELICDQIEATKGDLMQDTFYQPRKSTFTWMVLFEESFLTLSIHMKLIKQLICIWEEWEKMGFKVAQIELWNNLKDEQRQTACQMWNLIGENTEKGICLEQLIAQANGAIQEIIQIKENVTLCLDHYCQNACNKNYYLTHLRDIQNQLQRETISSIQIPRDIKVLQPFADRLNPIFKSKVWQRFLKEHQSDWTFIDQNSSSNKDELDPNEQQFSCLKILKQTEEILGFFTTRINNLWIDKTQSFISQLEQLFPEKYLIDYEFNILKSLLNPNIIPYLEVLLQYWKNREHINHICHGCINLFTQYKITHSDKLVVLQNLLHIDELTSRERCVTLYRDYCTTYSKVYSPSILNFISQWSSSSKLLQFLYSLTATDIDNLLDVVNDWDETLINTTAVLEFVLLKNFFDQVDILIKTIHGQKPLEFNDILNYFEQISNKTEFQNILSVFKLCSASLSSIQHIHTASTDKEQSKRKRILDIMQKAHVGFCHYRSKNVVNDSEHEFDVCIIDEKALKATCFNDLSELRDRARLIEYANTNRNQIQTYTENDIEQLRSIISFAQTIEVILTTLTALNRAGYPSVKQFLLPDKKFLCHQGNYDELKKFKSSLETQLADWDQQLCIMYENCVDLTYFSYQQLWIVEKALYEQTATITDDPGYHLLKFIGIDPQTIRLELLPASSEEFYARLKNMAQILNTQRIQRNSPLQEQHEIFLIQTSYKGILRAIFSLCNRNNISIQANHLFCCTKNTNWIELRAFIYRCFYSQTLQQLIQPELLSLLLQDQFAQLLNQLIGQCPNHLFCLGIITTISTTHLHLVNSLRTDRIVQTIYDQDLLSETALDNSIRTLIGDKCTLVTSRIAGLGKSTYIQKEILRLGKKSVKFPISGDVGIDTLMQRLRDQQIQAAPTKIAIHINIGPVENVQQLNEFLYCLTLFRCFRLGQMPVYVPADIPIYIELDSSLYLANLKEEIVVFRYLETKFIERIDWNAVEINSSTLQLVVNYLQAIEKETILTKDINEENLTTLDKSICIRLLQKYFLQKKNIEFLSWTQLSIFISVYYKLFSGFSKCAYFFVDPKFQSSLRLDILKSLLNSSDQFTTLSVETVRQNQRSIHGDETFIPFSKAIIRWDKSQPFTIIFTTDHSPLFIYKTLDNVPSSLIDAFLYYYKVINKSRTDRNGPRRVFFSLFNKKLSTNNAAQTSSPKEQLQEFLIKPNEMTHEQFFLRLTSLSTKYFTKKSICVKCFRQYEYNEQQCTSCPTKDVLIQPSSVGKTEDTEDFQRIIAKKLYSEYVLTADNYIKMLLIYLRVQSNLPVLIMGETGKINTDSCHLRRISLGCGKTALIQCLCQKILDDEMVVFRIHAGVTNKKIIETMHDLVKQAQEYSEKDKNKRLWVFLDEFNTTPNIGLLKEIVCERTILGEPLPENMVLLGACNPQRHKKNKQELDDDIGIRTHHSIIQHQTNSVDPSLLYSVVPIPETMLEHIWDYGHLDEATEKSYIMTILNTCQQLTMHQTWFTSIINLICISQKYFREREDVSSVSLRDVSRFCRFYIWFYDSDIQCQGQQLSTPYSFDSTRRASLLALFLCYYFRLNSSVDRKDYMTIIANSIKKFQPDMSFDSLNTLLDNEKMVLVKRMELPPSTAKNRALTDNIFVLFTCILNRIPVILCGKPGSSKTLAVQIVISNLRGKKSEDPFFQTLPQLIAISYQGSHTCTSESIIKVFAQADKCKEAKNDAELLPVIVFDEIGLAELSPHNPLKVLHSELETETCRYGFVGLSNWRLDASKMNRAVYLSCPDPDLDDLELTAIRLTKSMLCATTQAVPLDTSVIEGLAVTYMGMCEHMKQHRKQYYFGLRDYYSLIKGIVHDMLHKENKESDLYKIIRYQISVNFDGIIDASKFMWSTFCEHMHQEHKIGQYSSPTFDQLLHQSLSSRNGRFLMLIGEHESTFDYVERHISIKHPSLQTRTLVGSTLAGDFLSNTTYTEQYNTRILMDIILYAEKDVTLFLRGLGHLYDNLYDLFNQNFAVSAKKKYCRIALGSLYHPRCVIHDNFYCVVFVKQQELEKYDPPFLNRFEKHLIDVNTLIHERQKTVQSVLIKWIMEFLSMTPSENFSCPEHLFIEFSNDYIFNLVADAVDHLKISDNYNNDQEAIKYCQDQMMRTSSFDFPLLLSLESKNNRNYLIEQYYKIHTDLSFSSFLNQILEQEQHPQLLIYTYTQIYHVIDYSGIHNYQKWIEEVKLSHFKTELELMKTIKMHYQTGSSRLLCIRVDYHQDHAHLPMLKHLLINEQVVDKSRSVCLIFHLQRNKLNQTTNDVFFNGWTRVMIDDLQKHQIMPTNVLSNPSYADLIVHLNFLSLGSTFDGLISRCLFQCRYIVTNQNLETKINERRDRIIQQLSSHVPESNNHHQSLRSIIKNHLSKMIRNLIPSPNETQFHDWRQDLLTNEIIIGSSRSFNDALTKTVLFFLDKYLSALLAYYEKHSLIDSYVFLLDSNEKMRDQLSMIWSDCCTTTMKRIDITMINQNNIEIPFVFDLHLPCAIIEHDIIRQIRQTIARDRQNNDENWIDFAYKQLISTSIYGRFINNILDDVDLFEHYYHDQLTLARNEANIDHLSTSFIQRLLTSQISGTIKDRLRHLFIDYEELFEIMRLFEMSIPFIGEEEAVFESLDQQFIVHSNQEDKTVGTDTRLYRLIRREPNFYLITPGSSVISDKIFECRGSPFIEISLMNLLELLISPTNIDSINNMEQLITIYALVIQSMITLSHYGHYDISNLEKFNSFLRLASCISTLFSNDKALVVFKQIYNYSDFYTSFNTLEEIHNFITHLNQIIHQQQTPANDVLIHQTLMKLENDLLRNWSIDNLDQCSNILQFIHDHDLWQYSARTFTLIDRSLELSSTIRENGGEILQNDEYEEINQGLGQLNDPTRKIEVLMTMRIYIQLIFDENCEPRINNNNRQQLITILTTEFDHFKGNFDIIKQEPNDQTLELISSIAWIRYYLLYYVYALKHDIKDDFMVDIDRILVKDTSAFCSTVKLYIIKQLCHVDKITFRELCGKYTNRNIVWIGPMITRPSTERSLNARHDVVLPTPLFECHDEFMRINGKLSTHVTPDQLKELIFECSTKQDTSYCFIIWFIHYYTRFYVNNTLPDDQFVRLIKHEVNKELTTCFERIGYNLIYSLCTNFNDKSYFYLNPFISEEALHQRLVVLNIIAVLVSFKSVKGASLLSSLLFDGSLKMPQNYTEHFEKLDDLTGVAVANDLALIQMINIRTQINNQMQGNDQVKFPSTIFRCSSDCFWLFDFLNYAISDEQKRCPLCKKEISISRNGDLLVINKPHIQLNIHETLHFICKYIEQHKQKDCWEIIEARNYSEQPFTYHFMNFFTHAIFLFLNELNYMSTSMSVINDYFRKRIETLYILLRQYSLNVDQYYIWLYKLINHMMHKDFTLKGYLNSPENIRQLEKLIEEKLLIPHIDSVVGEIKEYKTVYANFLYGNAKQNTFVNFVDELIEDNEQYPLLNFFNVTNIHSINIIDHFYNQLHLLPNFEKTYPLTTFILRRLTDYENISYLYPLIKFMNYLIQQYDHRIKRSDAKKKTLSDYLKNDLDGKTIYEQFLNAWYEINLKEVCIDQRKYPFQHSQSKYDFENRTNISMFLLNKFNDEDNMLPTACLRTIGNLQNEIVDYFHSHVVNSNNGKYTFRTTPIQSIQQKHLFHFNTNQMRKLLVEKGLMINFAYGMSEEIIYDYDEIEWTIRNEISCLPSIDLKNIRYFNYQFELYDEHTSLINHMRERFQQTLFDDYQRLEIKTVVYSLDSDAILELSGSLEYILTYLRHVNNPNIIKTSTIETFINEYLHSNVCIDKNIIGKKPFSSIHLNYIIDFSELVEERIFDKILRDNIRSELCEKSFKNNEQTSVVNQFIDMILHDNNLEDYLKDLNCWISMFKRLLVRLLSPKVTINFELPLHDYVKRTDMWKGNVTEDNIRTIEIKDNIHLKHVFIILKGLETKQEEKTSTAVHQSEMSNDYRQQNNRSVTQITSSTSRSTNTAQRRKESKRKSDYR